jgi:hypothetical protein
MSERNEHIGGLSAVEPPADAERGDGDGPSERGDRVGAFSAAPLPADPERSDGSNEPSEHTELAAAEPATDPEPSQHTEALSTVQPPADPEPSQHTEALSTAQPPADPEPSQHTEALSTAQPPADPELSQVNAVEAPADPQRSDVPGERAEQVGALSAMAASGRRQVERSDGLGDPTAFGRVDADGTVYVKTATGERSIGSWQAGTPSEGLAHFARRFADLVTEVDLIEARLGSGTADAAHSLASIRRLRAGLDTAHVVGDIDGLAARLDKLATIADEKAATARAARESARVESIARKTSLVEEAEKLAAEATGWKTAGDRFKEILDEWKTIHGVDKKTDGELWKRYAAARDGFTRRRGAHFATLDASRKQAQTRKSELVAEAEELAASTDWNTTAARLKELMTEWKGAPRASKEAEQKLWERFRGAQDAFFRQRSEVFSARDAELKGNLDRKQELLAQAEAINVDADPRIAQVRFREIQVQWHELGRVPRDSASGLDRRLRTIEDRIKHAMDAAWRRTPPEASPLLAQMREQVAEAEQRLERAQAAGDPRRVKEAQQALESKRKFLAIAEHAG